jgi:hypothetical protein
VPLNGFVLSLGKFVVQNDIFLIDAFLVACEEIPRLSYLSVIKAINPTVDLQDDFWNDIRMLPSSLRLPAEGGSRSPPPDLPQLPKPGGHISEPFPDVIRP